MVTELVEGVVGAGYTDLHFTLLPFGELKYTAAILQEDSPKLLLPGLMKPQRHQSQGLTWQKH
jgi:hypothetical protein